MQITYKNRRLERVCTDVSAAEKAYGREMADKISMRIGQISMADTIEQMIQHHIGRCHALTNNRKGQYAMDLVHPYRLILTKQGDRIQIAHIIEIVDYH